MGAIDLFAIEIDKLDIYEPFEAVVELCCEAACASCVEHIMSATGSEPQSSPCVTLDEIDFAERLAATCSFSSANQRPERDGKMFDTDLELSRIFGRVKSFRSEVNGSHAAQARATSRDDCDGTFLSPLARSAGLPILDLSHS